MPTPARLGECTERVDSSFVERERTPREIIEKGIRHRLAVLSILNTVTIIENSGVERSRIAIHNWAEGRFTAG